jgi:hypothetical protein
VNDAMKEILKPFDQLDKKIEAQVGGVHAEVAGLRSELLPRMAELEMRVTTALLDAVRSNQEFASSFSRPRRGPRGPCRP